MTPADRAEWLARVEAMTRSERIQELLLAGWFYGQGTVIAAAPYEQKALDLIDALERDAALRAADIADQYDTYVAGKIRAEAARTEGV